MANLQQAPEIKSNGAKNRDTKKWGKAIRTHELEYAIMSGLGERDFVPMKIMLFLTGNAEGFRVAEKTIMERCNISESSYKNARKKLVGMGWITHIPGASITVNYDKIYACAKGITNNTPSSSNEKIKGDTDNTPSGDINNTPLGDTDNTHNNIRNNIKEYDNREINEPTASLISMNEPEAGEIKVNPKAERGSKENPLVMSKSSVLSTGAPIEYISDNLIRVVATGKYIKLEGK